MEGSYRDSPRCWVQHRATRPAVTACVTDLVVVAAEEAAVLALCSRVPQRPGAVGTDRVLLEGGFT